MSYSKISDALILWKFSSPIRVAAPIHDYPERRIIATVATLRPFSTFINCPKINREKF
jgi:hypothetical protein